MNTETVDTYVCRCICKCRGVCMNVYNLVNGLCEKNLVGNLNVTSKIRRDYKCTITEIYMKM